MVTGLPAVALVGGAAAFGAASAVLAAMGLGVPFLIVAVLAAAAAAIVVYGAARWLVRPPPPSPAANEAVVALEHRIQQLEESSSHLRHDLRGVLSPALMMADRLLRSEDPAIRRAGHAVVRSVERATALLAENKRETERDVREGEAAPEAPAEAPGAAPPPRMPVAGIGAPRP